jgi:hypothetical protein
VVQAVVLVQQDLLVLLVIQVIQELLDQLVLLELVVLLLAATITLQSGYKGR